MSKLEPGCNGLPRLRLQAADGACAEIYAHGAHLTSWIPAGGGEGLYLSGSSVFDGKTALRGGVPVIFPQFAGEGPLPKHGFARTLPWRLVEAVQPAQGAARALFELTDSEATRSVWPQAFRARLEVTVGGKALQTTLAVENTGQAQWQFTAALHSYLRVADVEAVRLRGLQGLRYRDTARGGEPGQEQAAELAIAGEVDRIYFDAPPALELRGPLQHLHIEAQGFADAVVWNPGAVAGARLKDLDPGGYRHFLCVEAAAIGRPVQLAPGARWSGSQRLSRLT